MQNHSTQYSWDTDNHTLILFRSSQFYLHTLGCALSSMQFCQMFSFVNSSFTIRLSPKKKKKKNAFWKKGEKLQINRYTKQINTYWCSKKKKLENNNRILRIAGYQKIGNLRQNGYIVRKMYKIKIRTRQMEMLSSNS